MVIKTTTCAYTEYKVYPAKGIIFVGKDGSSTKLIGRKARMLFQRKTKAQLITWTQAWRKHHKKVNVEVKGKKKRSKVQKVQREIVGMSLEAINKKKSNEEQKKMKDRKQKKSDIKAKTKSSKPANKDLKPVRKDVPRKDKKGKM
jgi:large subunit ribosomal protein L24e